MNKTIIIDWDDPKNLKKYISILQKRRKEVLKSLGFESIRFQSSTINVSTFMPIFEGILETDLSSLYRDQENDKQLYYVYVHCNPSKPLNVQADLRHIILASKFNLTHEPIYVGKGQGDRWLDLARNDSHRKIRSQLLKRNKDLLPFKIKSNLTSIDALALESKLIDCLGLKILSKEGFLCNLDEGVNPLERRKLYPSYDGLTSKILKKNGFTVK